jgi:hypothetical protein
MFKYLAVLQQVNSNPQVANQFWSLRSRRGQRCWHFMHLIFREILNSRISSKVSLKGESPNGCTSNFAVSGYTRKSELFKNKFYPFMLRGIGFGFRMIMIMQVTEFIDTVVYSTYFVYSIYVIIRFELLIKLL